MIVRVTIDTYYMSFDGMLMFIFVSNVFFLHLRTFSFMAVNAIKCYQTCGSVDGI